MKIAEIFKNLWNTFLYKHNPLLSGLEYLQNENEQLRQLLYKQLPENEIVNFFVEDKFGSLVNVKGGICKIVAELIVKEFIETGAINYVEMSFTSTILAPGEHFLLTIQKSSGLTPHQKLLNCQKELENEKSWKNW